MRWGTEQEIERRRRVWVAIAAYAYEVEASPIMTDGDFDELCKLIRPAIDTDAPVLDAFFAETFTPDSGLWIHSHPELAQVRACYAKHFMGGRRNSQSGPA